MTDRNTDVEVAILVSYIINEAQNNKDVSLKDIANEALEVSPFNVRIQNSTHENSESHPYEATFC